MDRCVQCHSESSGLHLNSASPLLTYKTLQVEVPSFWVRPVAVHCT